MGAAYTLWMVKRVLYGEVTHKHVADLQDINKREFFILAVLAAFVIGFGVYPKPITDLTHASVAQFLSHMAVSKLPAL